MALALEQLEQLRAPFYRVAGKAIVKNAEDKLLVLINKDGNGEMPGGGWDEGETLHECIAREVAEELHADVASFGELLFVMKGVSDHGWPVVRIFVATELKDTTSLQPDDGTQAALFLTREEFLQQHFCSEDAAITEFVDTIWPNKE